MTVLRNRNKRGNGMGAGSPARILAPGALVVATMTAGLVWADHNAGPTLRVSDDCPVEGPPPQTLVFAVDTTNQLVAVEPRTVELNLEDGIRKLKPGSRVALVEIGAVAPNEPKILFERCLPGHADNAARNRFSKDVMAPMKNNLAQLSVAPEAPNSAIIETILALADDEHLNPEGTALTIRLETDGLQHTSYANAYRPGAFPPAPTGTLRNVDIEIDALRNPMAMSRQPKAFEQLISWLRGGSIGHVLFERPAWLKFAAGGGKDVSP